MGFVLRYKNMNENSRIILRNTISSFLIKGASLCFALATTPAFIRYFSDNTILGVWYTLLSVLLWFLNFDLGIGNGIRNHLVKDFSRNDYESARKTLSSGLFSSAAVTVILTVIGILVIKTIDLNWLVNVTESVVSAQILRKSFMIVFLGIMVRFFLSCFSSVFYALQLSSVNHLLALCVSFLQLLFVTFVHPQDAQMGLLIVSIAYAIISNTPVTAAAVIVFATKLKTCRPSIRYIEREYVKSVVGMGMVFFACQIMYMFLMNTNEFLISHLFGPQYTVEYTFYYKLTSLISTVATLVLTPIWSVVTKALVEEQFEWLRSLYKKLQLFGFAVVLVQFAFILVQQCVMDLWLGAASIAVDYGTAIAFACFGSVFIYTSILSTMVCGMEKMMIQAVSYSLGVFLKLGVVYAFAPIAGHWSIVVWSNVLVFLPYCVVQHIDLERYFRAKIKNLDMQTKLS